MSLKQVYITQTASFFPNEPVQNDEMEEYLGYINNTPSKSKAIVLRNNGIKRRYYAMTKDKKPTHTNAELAAASVRKLFKNKEELKEVELLSCGTSSPDQLMPSHGVMVHGCLPELGALEVVSPSGVCCAGMHALKYAYLAVRAGDVKKAIASGSERLSPSLVASTFEDEAQRLKELTADPYISFDKEFLRWMLSDGSASFLLSDEPAKTGISLRIEWIEGISHASTFEACMYMGCEKQEDGTLKSFRDYPTQEVISKSIMSIKQDVKLLSKNIVPLGGEGLKKVFAKHNLKSEDITYFLPHISSEFFKDKIYEQLIENEMPIPYEKWFLNLSKVGNVGAASAYLMVDELFHSGKLKKGDKLLLLVPESSRFSYMFTLLTVC